MFQTIPYNREMAVRYAHHWAYSRNPRYYNFDSIGGDCTNFASQCLYAGTGVMNFTPTLGWYYYDVDNRAPAWTGVPFFYNFITREAQSAGPFGVETTIERLEIGDFLQFKFPEKKQYGHTPIVVDIGYPPMPETILVAAHSDDTDWRPLSTYPVKNIRYLHILGAYKEYTPEISIL